MLNQEILFFETSTFLGLELVFFNLSDANVKTSLC